MQKIEKMLLDMLSSGILTLGDEKGMLNNALKRVRMNDDVAAYWILYSYTLGWRDSQQHLPEEKQNSSRIDFKNKIFEIAREIYHKVHHGFSDS